MASYIWSASLNMTAGCIFKHFRHVSNMDQATAAEISKLPASTISKLESGSANITIEHIFILCGIYKISLRDFAQVVELAVLELQKEKVFTYLEKSESESLKIKEHTVVVDTDNSLLSLGAGAAGFAALLAVAPAALLGVGIGSVATPLALAALSRYKGNKSKKNIESTNIEPEITEVETESEHEKIELPKLSSKQIYSLLKDFLENEAMKGIAVDGCF